ncbi:MAG: 2,3-bisphosphoglycerate-independent phosphoglycerate mutase [Deltaproteobacteria bacterium]|nr:2,3-bisphosphoglycerate-independent phosphoglycerate mutase [Deltaproteobacteria bacterium]
MDTDFTLQPHPKFKGRPGPLLVVVMDGVGIGRHDEGNAVWCARTPTLDAIHRKYLHTQLQAHGVAVGLPSDEDMGNSEVGHNALGAGRVFDQGSKLVSAAIRSGRLFEGKVWRELVDTVDRKRSALHLIGLLSDGNVHSHIDQLLALIERAADEGVQRLFVHALLDGRDVPEQSALQYVDQLEALLARHDGRDGRVYKIASGGGRMFVTMDRYQADWRIVERGWRTHVRGEGRRFGSAREAIETYRREKPGIIDQDLPPFVVGDERGPLTRIEDGHGVIFFNFRGDRAIEITRAFEEERFDKFERGPRPDVVYAGMMQYDGDLQVPKKFLVDPPDIDRTFGEFLARNRIPQLAIAETQKFGHVTYFWNGNRTGMFDPQYEKYIEVPSDRVPFETAPRMKAEEIADQLIDELRGQRFRFLRVNFANGDMVGHTGVREAAITAVEAVDEALGRILPVVEQLGGIALVSADHGNADEMYEWDKKAKAFKINKATGRPAAKTAHTLNPVTFVVVDPQFKGEYRLAELKFRGLSNVAATALALMGYQAPAGFDPPLIEFA